MLGSGPLSKEYDLTAPRRVTVCTWASKIYIDQFKIEQAAANPLEPEPAWAKIFGAVQPQEIQRELAALAQFLLDDQADVRLAAEGLLRRAGSLAVVSLQEVAKTAPSEKVRLLRDLADVLMPPPLCPKQP